MTKSRLSYVQDFYQILCYARHKGFSFITKPDICEHLKEGGCVSYKRDQAPDVNKSILLFHSGVYLNHVETVLDELAWHKPKLNKAQLSTIKKLLADGVSSERDVESMQALPDDVRALVEELFNFNAKKDVLSDLFSDPEGILAQPSNHGLYGNA